MTEGYPELISLIKTRMKSKYGIGRDFDSIIITSGAQQVMDLSTKVLCNEGDVVICESPSFIGSTASAHITRSSSACPSMRTA